jgi:RNA-directed DNA polymerase
MHHFNVESLTASFHSLDGRKAVGADGIEKEDYGKRLQGNIEELVVRMRRMAYRPGPVREVLIPKEGKPGATRPLGISNLEDKIVQSQMRRILESIYEPRFLDCSYGFRPGRGCHDAIRDLRTHLAETSVQTVIDVDLADYFGSIRHGELEAMLRETITDKTFLRYLARMFKAGTLSKGELRVSDEGVPQGSICSPVLANVFAHYVIDDWFENVVKKHCRGRVQLFRYCDDFVICCQRRDDAERIHVALGRRLGRFGLKLNETKTRLVSFDKFDHARGRSQGTFDFLGFTFYVGVSRNGKSIPKLKTSSKRLRSKLKRVNEWARAVRGRYRLPDIWRFFCAKLQGHINYYGITFNTMAVNAFVWRATRILFKWLNRRSQRRSFSWERFLLFLRFNPLPKIVVRHSLIIPTSASRVRS